MPESIVDPRGIVLEQTLAVAQVESVNRKNILSTVLSGYPDVDYEIVTLTEHT